MEWYWIVAIIAAFVGALVGFYFLQKKGIVSSVEMDGIVTLINGVYALIESLGLVVKNDVTKTFTIIVDLLRKAVYAAENLYYNNEITKEERKEKCLEIFDELMKANEIELTPAIASLLDSLIAAICEEMGHKGEEEE